MDKDALRRLRIEARLSMRELCARSGVSVGQISMIENGQRSNPSLRIVAALARALGREITDLVLDEPNGHAA